MRGHPAQGIDGLPLRRLMQGEQHMEMMATVAEGLVLAVGPAVAVGPPSEVAFPRSEKVVGILQLSQRFERDGQASACAKAPGLARQCSPVLIQRLDHGRVTLTGQEHKGIQTVPFSSEIVDRTVNVGVITAAVRCGDDAELVSESPQAASRSCGESSDSSSIQVHQDLSYKRRQMRQV